MSHSDSPVSWLKELLLDVDELPTPRNPQPYFSQRNTAISRPQTTIESTARRVNVVVRELVNQHYFARVIGYDCIDGNGDVPSTIPMELEQRVGKPDLWEGHFGTWSEDDLCDFVEVLFDLVARPTKEQFHSYGGCGWHPTAYSISSGQAIYLWRINAILDASNMGLRLAEHGEDRGRIVRSQPPEIETLISESLAHTSSQSDDVDHAIALFRKRNATRPEKRSAVISLVGILEDRRALIHSTPLAIAEDALFQIANKFDIRHRNASQLAEYDDAFLDWIFYWYLATINLTEYLLAMQSH